MGFFKDLLREMVLIATMTTMKMMMAMMMVMMMMKMMMIWKHFANRGRLPVGRR